MAYTTTTTTSGVLLSQSLEHAQSRLAETNKALVNAIDEVGRLRTEVTYLRGFIEYVRNYPQGTDRDYQEYLQARDRLLKSAGIEPEQPDLFNQGDTHVYRKRTL